MAYTRVAGFTVRKSRALAALLSANSLLVPGQRLFCQADRLPASAAGCVSFDWAEVTAALGCVCHRSMIASAVDQSVEEDALCTLNKRQTEYPLKA